MAAIDLEGVTKTFPDGTVAVRDLDLAIGDGEFVVLVGPSGSGKTTALRMVAGLEEVTAGTVRIGGRPVNDLAPRQRDVAMVFQNYALYPHMTVYDNMALGLRMRDVPRDEIRTKVVEAARLLGIEGLLSRKPRKLSGGQRQRVAMGRAIVREPAAFLMDEPLSNLDAKLRVQMRAEIMQLHQRVGTTTMYVTHDQVEAITMADRVAVLRDGVLEQVDAPRAVYDGPVNLFVAEFMGSPSMNLARGRLEAGDGGRLSVAFGSQRLVVAEALARGAAALERFVDREVVVGIRPEDLEDAAFVATVDPGRVLSVTVGLLEMLGSETVVHFEVGAPPAGSAAAAGFEDGDGLPPPPVTGGGALFTARVHPRTRATTGSGLCLAVDVDRLYLFDPATGAAVATPSPSTS